jgi:hypothetical protein
MSPLDEGRVGLSVETRTPNPIAEKPPLRLFLELIYSSKFAYIISL